MSWRASAFAPYLVRVKTTVRPGRAGQVHEHGQPLLAVHLQHVVGHRGDRRLRRVGLVHGGVRQVLAHQPVDGAVQRRGEQQALAAGRRAPEQSAHRGQEAQVGHVVGLVEHGDLHLVERAVALVDQVLEPAGAGHENVHAAAQRVDLRALPDAAEDGARGQAGGLGERAQHGVDLAGELPGGGQDERARGAGGGAAAAGQAGDEGQQEGQGLARARPAAAEHVATGECVGQRGLLDGGGDVDVQVGQDGGQACGHAEIDEGGHTDNLCVRSCGQAGPGFRTASRGAGVKCFDARQLAGRNATS